MIVLPTAIADVRLQTLERADAPAYFRLIDRNRAHLSQYGDTASKYPTLESVLLSLSNAHGEKIRFGIWNRHALVGVANLTPVPAAAEIGFLLGAEFQGKGYACAAVRSLTVYALNAGFHEVYGLVHPHNARSMNVLLRAGYADQGLHEEHSRIWRKFSKFS